MSSSSILISYF